MIYISHDIFVVSSSGEVGCLFCIIGFIWIIVLSCSTGNMYEGPCLSGGAIFGVFGMWRSGRKGRRAVGLSGRDSRRGREWREGGRMIVSGLTAILWHECSSQSTIANSNSSKIPN